MVDAADGAPELAMDVGIVVFSGIRADRRGPVIDDVEERPIHPMGAPGGSKEVDPYQLSQLPDNQLDMY